MAFGAREHYTILDHGLYVMSVERKGGGKDTQNANGSSLPTLVLPAVMMSQKFMKASLSLLRRR